MDQRMQAEKAKKSGGPGEVPVDPLTVEEVEKASFPKRYVNKAAPSTALAKSKAKPSEAPTEDKTIDDAVAEQTMAAFAPTADAPNDDGPSSLVGAYRVGINNEERINSPGMLVPAPVNQESMRLVSGTPSPNPRRHVASVGHGTEVSSLTTGSSYTSPNEPSVQAELVKPPALASAVPVEPVEEGNESDNGGQERLSKKEVADLRNEVNRNTNRNNKLLILVVVVVLIVVAVGVTVVVLVTGGGGDESPSPGPGEAGGGETPTVSIAPTPEPTPFTPNTEPTPTGPFTPTTDEMAAIIRALLEANGVTVRTDTSPQGQAFRHMVQDSYFIDSGQRLTQRYALLVLWFATDGPSSWSQMPWIDSSGSGWASSTDHCGWNRIECFDDSMLIHKIRLNCGDSGFCGGIRGQLPTELGLITTMKLIDFHFHTAITGTVPREIGRLSALTWLDLNGLTGLNTGPIPQELFVPSLEWLGLSNSRFTGYVPTSINALDNLEKLYLFDNDFTGGYLNVLCDTLVEPAAVDCDDGIECECCREGDALWNFGADCPSA